MTLSTQTRWIRRRDRQSRGLFHAKFPLLKRTATLACILTILAGSYSGVLQAASGDLDSSFGPAPGGVVRTDFGNLDWARSVAVQRDGKIVVAGTTRLPVAPVTEQRVPATTDFVLARYRPDGLPDDSFGSGGRVRTDFGWTEGAKAIAIQDDGKLIVAGESYGRPRPPKATQSEFAIARYDPDGALDQSFGIGGKVTTDFCYYPTVEAVTVQNDGKILVAGTAQCAACVTLFAVARYNPDGALDAEFRGRDTGCSHPAGVVLGPDDGRGRAYGVAIMPDRKIVVAGKSMEGDARLIRYMQDGATDQSFGQAGVVTTDFGGDDDSAFGVVSLGAGIAIAGRKSERFSSEPSSIAMARYLENGSLDSSFDADGLMIDGLNTSLNTSAFSLVVQGQKLVVAGSQSGCFDEQAFPDAEFGAGDGSCDSGKDFLLGRYEMDGRRDETFGSGGKIITDLGSNNDSARALAVQPDGRLIAAGPSGNDMTVVRYLGSTADLSISVSGPVEVDVGTDLTYNIQVSNLGPDSAPSVTVTSPIPSGASYKSAVASHGGCNIAGSEVVCELGQIDVGVIPTITLTLGAPVVAGQVTSTSTVTTPMFDPNLANNTATVISRVKALVLKDPIKDPPNEGVGDPPNPPPAPQDNAATTAASTASSNAKAPGLPPPPAPPGGAPSAVPVSSGAPASSAAPGSGAAPSATSASAQVATPSLVSGVASAPSSAGALSGSPGLSAAPADLAPEGAARYAMVGKSTQALLPGMTMGAGLLILASCQIALRRRREEQSPKPAVQIAL